MDRIRVCELITELGPAGAERCIYELARRLDKSLFDVQVAALRGGEVEEWLRQAGVPVFVLGIKHRFDLVKLRRLRDFLREQKIDLLHTHLYHADLVGRTVARSAGVKHLVHTVHVAEARFRPWQYLWARLAAGRCDRIVCVSKAVRDHHAHKTHLPLEKYEVIYNGIDAAAYARDESRRAAVRGQWGVGADELVLAFVGRLDHQKNIELFLQAAREMRRRSGRVRAVIAGDGPERAMVEDFIRHECHWAKWLGFTRDVPGVLSGADIFVLPSRWEGFGLAAAEAMAAGLPVVSTRVPGITEVIDDGRTGILVASENHDELVAAVARLVDDPALRQSIGQAGIARVAEHFSIQANVQAHQRLYLSVLGR